MMENKPGCLLFYSEMSTDLKLQRLHSDIKISLKIDNPVSCGNEIIHASYLTEVHELCCSLLSQLSLNVVEISLSSERHNVLSRPCNFIVSPLVSYDRISWKVTLSLSVKYFGWSLSLGTEGQVIA